MNYLIDKKYNYTGILPYAKDKNTNRIYFLLGREAIVPGWSESGKFSDFGGIPHDKEEAKASAIRECFEETMGILGCEKALLNQINTDGKWHDIKENNALICLLSIDYDINIPTYYGRIYNYFTKCAMNHPKWKGHKYLPSCPEGYLEKIELRWFSWDDICECLTDTDKGILLRSAFLKSMGSIFEIFINELI